MNAKRMLVWVWLLLAPALGGSLGYGFLGFQGAWQGGGGGFGTFQGVALGGSAARWGAGFVGARWLAWRAARALDRAHREASSRSRDIAVASAQEV